MKKIITQKKILKKLLKKLIKITNLYKKNKIKIMKNKKNSKKKIN